MTEPQHRRMTALVEALHALPRTPAAQPQIRMAAQLLHQCGIDRGRVSNDALMDAAQRCLDAARMNGGRP